MSRAAPDDELWRFLYGVASAIKRGATCAELDTEVDAVHGVLINNWYETVDSLKLLSAPDIHTLGVPLRFAREIIRKVGGDAGERSEASPSMAGGKRGRRDSDMDVDDALPSKKSRAQDGDASYVRYIMCEEHQLPGDLKAIEAECKCSINLGPPSSNSRLWEMEIRSSTRESMLNAESLLKQRMFAPAVEEEEAPYSSSKGRCKGKGKGKGKGKAGIKSMNDIVGSHLGGGRRSSSKGKAKGKGGKGGILQEASECSILLPKCDSAFPLRQSVEGPGRRYLKHIEDASDASVEVIMREGAPWLLQIKARSAESLLEQARKLCLDLADKITDQAEEWMEGRQANLQRLVKV
eukprot:CAMPEP_0178374260 /NCGR_PEP_ID=MMETSP0689_2-20121128/2285_1 /TAXON_ID=160604 /ORGANISM="Amphidinium massartii, Strain CS-259" /LENGTH=350 /DNA_ID=CAMNT_0019994225 /DNA_START=99 /DNA_END=1147 /DNA_ORIENTATION=-